MTSVYDEDTDVEIEDYVEEAEQQNETEITSEGTKRPGSTLGILFAYSLLVQSCIEFAL